MTETTRFIQATCLRLCIDVATPPADVLERCFADHWAGVKRRVPEAARRAEIGRGLIVSMAMHLRAVEEPGPEIIARVVRVFGVTAERAGEICGKGA